MAGMIVVSAAGPPPNPKHTLSGSNFPASSKASVGCRASPPGVKMMQRAAARADRQPVRRGKRGAHIALGLPRRLVERKPFGKSGGQGGGERAAGAVGVFGGDARRGQPQA